MRILILQARNFGDAVIATQIVNSLGESFRDIKIDILTRSSFKAIYKNNPYVKNLYFANFPMGTGKNFNFKEFVNLTSYIFKLQKNKYDMVINNVGDFREILIGKLINPKENTSFVWDDNHVFKDLIRPGLYRLIDRKIIIPRNIVNIYEAQEYFLKCIGCKIISKPKIFLSKKVDRLKAIGIHPLASQKSKLWSDKKWNELIKNIISLTNYEVWIFGAPSEKNKLLSIFKESLKDQRVKLRCENLESFFENLSSVEILIGLDSFSIHSAYAVGTKSIMLNGSNNYEIWAPPDTKVISKGHTCPFYPCYNKPKCVGKDFEYICMRNIEVEDVLKALTDELRYSNIR